MTFFPAYLYINKFNSELSEKASAGLLDVETDDKYSLVSIAGYKAIYQHKSGVRLLVVAKASKYQILSQLG